jgi:hypothetical protein
VPALADDALYKSCDMVPSGSISVEVVDTGPGLSEIELTKLFGEGVQFNPNDLQAGQGYVRVCVCMYLFIYAFLLML